MRDVVSMFATGYVTLVGTTSVMCVLFTCCRDCRCMRKRYFCDCASARLCTNVWFGFAMSYDRSTVFMSGLSDISKTV